MRILLFLFLPCFAYSQSPGAAPPEFKVLDSLAKIQFVKGNYDSVIFYNREKERLAEQVGNWKQMQNALNIQASMLTQKGEYRAASVLIEKGLKFGREKLPSTDEEYLLTFSLLADLKKRTGQLDSAVWYYKSILATWEKNDLPDSPAYLEIYRAIGDVFNNQSKFQEALEYQEKGVSIAERLRDSMPVDAGRFLSALGRTYHNLELIDKSIAVYDDALKIFYEKLDSNHTEIATAIYHQAQNHSEIGEYGKAIEFYKKVLEIDLKTLGENHEYLITDYGSIGDMYRKIGDFENARHWLEKSMSMGKKILGEGHYKMANRHHILSNFYKDQGGEENLQTALYLQKKSIEIELENFGETRDWLAGYYGDLGNIYELQGKLDSAEYWTQKGIRVSLSRKERDGEELGGNYSNLARIQELKGDYEKAIFYLKKEQKSYLTYLTENSPLFIASQIDEAKMLAKKGEEDSALLLLKNCLLQLIPNLRLRNELSNPAIIEIKDLDIHPLRVLMRLFETKAEILSKYPGDFSKMSAALDTYDKLLNCGTLVQNRFWDESSVLFSQARFRTSAERGIATAHLLFEKSKEVKYLESGFFFAEKMRASALNRFLKEKEALASTGIPEEIISDLRRKKRELGRLTQNLYLQENQKTEGETGTLKATVFEKRLELQKTIETLEKKYPKYAELKSIDNSSNLKKTQENLESEDAVLVEYFLGDENIYGFKIFGGGAEFIRMDYPEKFQEVLQRFNQSISDGEVAEFYAGKQEVFEQFKKDGYFLFENLIQPLSLSDNEKLVISPDGVLHFLPFEILLTTLPDMPKSDYAELPYLLKKHAVRYTFAASFLTPKNQSGNALGIPLAFAPEYKSETLFASRTSFGALQFIEEEALSVAKILNGEALTKNLATESNFKNLGPGRSILHLAMHAFTNDKNPNYSGLVFSKTADETDDSILHAYEIFGMDIGAQLAVLSACNTGYGKPEKGEGIMSLARAFRQANCPNIVMSLWQADDGATAQIMAYFYQNLKNGIGKDEALRQAKLSYLASSPKTFPHYWAAFVLNGDDKPVDINSGIAFYFFAGIFLLALFLIFFFRSR